MGAKSKKKSKSKSKKSKSGKSHQEIQKFLETDEKAKKFLLKLSLDVKFKMYLYQNFKAELITLGLIKPQN